MTSFNIAGLSSGIDTASLISQLMTVAARPQTALKTQLTGLQSVVTAYQDINTKLAAVKTAASALAGADAWAATTATSSDKSVVATGSTAAVTGSSSTFTVNKVAKAQVSTIAIADPANAANQAAGIDILDAVGTVAHHIDLTSGSAAGVAAAINSQKAGVRAAVITTDTGTILQLTSTATGEANAFGVSGLTGVAKTMTAAQNAKITVGDPATGGYTVTSASNTFANAIPGVTFTVSAEVPDVTIAVTADSTSISNAVKSLVTAVNTALSTIATDTAQGSVLSGDRLVSGITQQLLGIVSSGSSGQSFATAGVSLTATGALTFDAAAFASAYASDPAGLQAMVGTTLAANYSTMADEISNSTTGSLTRVIKDDTDQQSTLTRSIAAWDIKLADQKSLLQTRYAAMEASLSKLKSQSAYLTSVFDAMSASAKSSSSSS